MCDCIEKLGEALAARKLELNWSLDIGDGISFMPITTLARTKSGNTKDGPNIKPNFCAMCGEKVGGKSEEAPDAPV